MSGRRQSELERQGDFIAAAELLVNKFTEAVAQLRGMAVNNVLFSGTVELDDDGLWSQDWAVPYGTVSVNNAGTAGVTVTNGTPQVAAPGSGAGVHTIAARSVAVVGLAGNTLTIYGRAGERIELVVYSSIQPPAFGNHGDAPGTFANGETITVDNTAGGKLLLAANDDRREAVIQNTHATAPFMLGLAGVDADTGITVLVAGQTAHLNTTQAIYGFRTTATDSTALASEAE